MRDGSYLSEAIQLHSKREQMDAKRLRSVGWIILTVYFAFLLVAQWLDNRERSARLHELDLRIEKLDLRIEKLKKSKSEDRETHQ
jgi:hypothetical protein